MFLGLPERIADATSSTISIANEYVKRETTKNESKIFRIKIFRKPLQQSSQSDNENKPSIYSAMIVKIKFSETIFNTYFVPVIISIL